MVHVGSMCVPPQLTFSHRRRPTIVLCGNQFTICKIKLKVEDIDTIHVTSVRTNRGYINTKGLLFVDDVQNDEQQKRNK